MKPYLSHISKYFYWYSDGSMIVRREVNFMGWRINDADNLKRTLQSGKRPHRPTPIFKITRGIVIY